MSDNIKVVVKVRPLISREIEEKLFYQWRVKNDRLYQIDQNEKDVGPYFTFDKVYDKDTKTCDVYNDIAKPIVEAATAGFNGTIFAYGQTSSGKTYTMTGTEESPGIIQLAVLNLFDLIKNIPDRDFLVRVSFVEIYNETLIDLLNIEKKIKIQDTLQGVKVDATERVTSSPEEVLDAMKEGKANRQTAATYMNEESSRSHSIFQITIESREHVEGEEDGGCVNVSQLNLVDLAGSERAGQTGATGLRFKEGTHINKSLSSLALVIKQLSDDPSRHVNYRDSKLTRILQNSLGGNAKTSIICAITPAAVEETISTLQFANRAKSIKNKPAVNAVTTNATMIQQLTRQLSTLKTELESKKSLEKDNYTLQKQIAALQRLILNGFGQRSTAEILNPRRKLVQPRRVTISTLHSIQEDPVPSMPKFCTPSLKYNPLVVPGDLDFQPIQNTLSLPTLPEEPPRLVTPPLKDRKVNFQDEIIELDSDDDCTSDVQTCPTSPYHQCYESTKTPPCVLRKNAKRAEKNLQDIVELTEREKIYTPDVVEVMEKLDRNSTVIANLEDDLNKLTILSKEKDFEIHMLKNQISRAEEQIKMLNLAKVDLETRCKNYHIKLTDSEVSYETLKKKAKTREEELLSLLEERDSKTNTEIIGKISTNNETNVKNTNFLEAAQNISLVNIENEQQSIISVQSDLSQIPLIQEFDLQKQLSLKNNRILELEAIISANEKKIISLETISHDYESNLDSYKEKLAFVEKELSQYTHNADALNKIVESQKKIIDSVNVDIESYKNLIQELQLKLQLKENTHGNLSDKELESLIANETTFLANNENIQNVIQCLKMALQSKNEEIKSLKTMLDETENVKEELANKNTNITFLTTEIQKLKEQVEENVIFVNKMLLEKKDWSDMEKQLNLKLTGLEESIKELTKKNNALLNQVKELKQLNEDSNKKLYEKEQALNLATDNHKKQTNDMCDKIEKLEKTIFLKDDIIASLNKTREESEDNLSKAKSALNKVQSIVSILTGDIQNVPDIIDSFKLLFNTLHSDLCNLENIATGIKSQKEELLGIIKQCENEYSLIEKQIDDIIDNLNNTDTPDLEKKIAINQINLDPYNENPNNIELQEQSNYTKCYLELNSRINKLFTIFKMKQLSYQQSLNFKDREIEDFTGRILSIHSNIEAKDQELLLVRQEKDDEIKKKEQLLKLIFEKSSYLIQCFKLENNISSVSGNSEDHIEYIFAMLDKIADHIKNWINKNEYERLQNALIEAKIEIQELTEENLKYLNDITRVESTNVGLSEDLNKIRQENQKLAVDLESSSKLLELLREELNLKVEEMKSIETKAREWKVQFINLDFLMKEQMHTIQLENTNLKAKYLSSKIDDKYDYECCESDSNNDNSSYQPSLSLDTNNDLQSPQSLLTLCCNKIIDSIQHIENKALGHSSCSNTQLSETACRCDKLDLIQLELQETKGKNTKLQSTVKELQIENQNIFKEYSEVQNEVKSLLDVTYELQKKVVNHRTNLSTLTAMTYAENKLLSSQIKFLQHHHNRFHNVCQRDIPSLKKQLLELMTLLKSDHFRPNDSFKRYSLPSNLDVTNVLSSNFKNESTLDSDLLMLDTNLTLTTTADTTLIGHDQTYFDVTQISVCNEVACQTDLAPVTDSTLLHSQISVNLNINEMVEKMEELKKENNKLREMVNEYTAQRKTNNSIVDTQPICTKDENQIVEHISEKLNFDDMLCNQEHYMKEIETLNQKILNVEVEKCSILEKYKNLQLEIPSVDALVKQITTLEIKVNEVDELKSKLNNKNREIAALQDENDSLSTQVMDAISEVDDLKKEHDKLKVSNIQLSEKCLQLKREVETLQSEYQDAKHVNCHECESKSKLINTLEEKFTVKSHNRISRSFSDSDRTSSYNTICTLQSELHAGKEDCNTLKEEVTTIKKHLDRSNLSMAQTMDLDESHGEPNIFPYSKDFESVEAKCKISEATEDHSLEMYTLDKVDCFNYYAEMTGAKKDDIGFDFKIVDVMKMLCSNLLIKHGNEVENLVNKLRDFEASKTQLQMQLDSITKQYSCKTKELQEKSYELETIETLLSCIRNSTTNTFYTNVDNDDVVNNFKETILNPLDTQFRLNSTVLFDSIITNVVNRFTRDIDEKINQNSKLEQNMKSIQAEINTLNINFTQLKSQLTEKENECKLLKMQKERIQEISNAVTLDIVKKEQDLDKILTEGCKKLSEQNILNQGDIERILPLDQNIDTVFNLVISWCTGKSEVDELNNNLILEVTNLKFDIAAKDSELNKLTECLNEKESNLLTHKMLIDDINQIYSKKVEENNTNLAIIQKMNEDINNLRQSLLTKETTLKTLQSNLDIKENDSLEDMITELLHSKENLKQELVKLKSINEEIMKEKDNYAKQLEESSNTIKENKMELEALTAETLVLKESVKENVSIIENLKQEITLLLDQNSQVKENLQEKTKECSRLETNIKTHEKTAEIQSRMIMRLQKQKEEDNKHKEKEIEELKQKCAVLQKECDMLNQDMMICREDLQELKISKLSLEAHISELQEVHKSRPSIETMVEGSRRRRQSIHDSKRMFAEDKPDAEDHTKMETVCGARTRNDDFFMEVDGNESNRSTPMRRSKGRDSSQCKNEQEEEGGSRPSSVQATRRRRQSVHDRHRSALAPSPAPHDHPRKLGDHQDCETPGDQQGDNELTQLKSQLASCQEELEELREKYKELDDECETCAQYLRERDEQCLQLKREKVVLEQAVTELKAKLANTDINGSGRRSSLCDAAVNTDEDWTNLHSVVVDRMSYDAEVEKNKKLTKVVEELRFKKQDLKNTITKMQKALEKKSSQSNRELEAMKSELNSCKEELEELKERYKELDEECDTCAQYLRERDEQCRKLKEAKNALEAKLKEYEEDTSCKTLTVRKKRQSLHDQNRQSTSAELVDAATETSDDFLSYQVEKDNRRIRMPDDTQIKELKRLRFMVDKMSQQKAALEQQLMAVSAHAPLLVATGSAIVQNQQLTDVMKENQKLKKVNAKLINICKKRGKTLDESNRENQDPSESV